MDTPRLIKTMVQNLQTLAGPGSIEALDKALADALENGYEVLDISIVGNGAFVTRVVTLILQDVDVDERPVLVAEVPIDEEVEEDEPIKPTSPFAKKVTVESNKPIPSPDEKKLEPVAHRYEAGQMAYHRNGARGIVTAVTEAGYRTRHETGRDLGAVWTFADVVAPPRPLENLLKDLPIARAIQERGAEAVLKEMDEEVKAAASAEFERVINQHANNQANLRFDSGYEAYGGVTITIEKNS